MANNTLSVPEPERERRIRGPKGADIGGTLGRGIEDVPRGTPFQGIGGFFKDIGEGAHEWFMGRDPSADIVQQELLTPEQQEMLSSIMQRGGGVRAAGIDTSGLSMDDLAAFNARMAESQAAQALGEMITDQGVDTEFIRTNIREPLMEEAQEAVRGLGRRTAGAGGFFGSDRAVQEGQIQEAFAEAETRAIADLARENRQMAIDASRALTDINRLEMEGRLAALNAEMQTAFKNADFRQAAEIQNSINLLQAALTPTFENIAFQWEGGGGAGGGLLSGLGQALGGSLFG